MSESQKGVQKSVVMDKYRLYLQHLQERVHESARRFKVDIERLASGGYNGSEDDQMLVKFIASALLGDLSLEEGDIEREGQDKDII